MAEAPTWAEMMGRAIALAFDTAVGTLEWSDPEEEAPDDRGAISFWFAQPDRWRIDDERGPLIITGGDRSYVRTVPEVMAELSPDSGVGLSHDPRRLIDGRQVVESLSDRNDFSRPMGPAVETEVGGRRGWRFVLAPPAHKPAPLEVVLDDATGVVLEYRSQGADYRETLTSFDADAAIDEDVFTWAGQIDTAWAGGEGGEARHRRLADHAWPSPTWWHAAPPLRVFDGDPDEGWFVGGLGWDEHAILARWRPGADLGERITTDGGHRHVHRWHRDGWDWLLATDEEFSVEDVRRIIESIPPD